MDKKELPSTREKYHPVDNYRAKMKRDKAFQTKVRIECHLKNNLKLYN